VRIVIYGIGALGSLFGARLSAHADVTLVGHWPEQLRALSQGPLTLLHPDGREEHVRVCARTAEEAEPGCDVALILTKSTKTQAAAEVCARALAPDGLAVTLQNGLGNLEVLAQHVGAQRAVQGVTMQGAAMVGPGVVRLGGEGPTVLAAHGETEERVRALADLLNRAGLAAQVADDVRGIVWGKLASNAAINPLTAILGVPNGALLEVSPARELMRAAAEEVAAVAAAQGIRLPFEDVRAQVEQVARRTALNRSSMLQDVSRGAETEIESICGAVVRAGQSVGVPTPVNAVLLALVKALEQTARSRAGM